MDIVSLPLVSYKAEWVAKPSHGTATLDMIPPNASLQLPRPTQGFPVQGGLAIAKQCFSDYQTTKQEDEHTRCTIRYKGISSLLTVTYEQLFGSFAISWTYRGTI